MKKEKEAKKRKHPFIKVFLGCIAVVGILVSTISFLGASYLHGKMEYDTSYEDDVAADNDGTAGKVAASAKQPFKAEGVKNILLIGNDSRSEGEDGRSDAMILISISSKTNTIHMTSILRDIYVDIPEYKSNRLNAAYAFGGPELLMETLEENFDISVNRYMLVNFQAFAKVVDAVGGVDIEVTNEEVQYINDYLVEYNQLEGRAEGTDYLDASLNGKLHLNGPQALAFCRNRYIGSDFARTERQRKVLSAIFEKAPTTLFTNTNELMDGLLSNVKTNLKKSEISGLMMQAPMMLTYDMIQASIPLEGTYSNASIRGMSVLEVDFETNKQYIQKEIYGK